MAFMRLEAFSGLCFFMGLVIVLANLLPYLFTHLGSSNLAGSLQQRMIPITAGPVTVPHLREIDHTTGDYMCPSLVRVHWRPTELICARVVRWDCCLSSLFEKTRKSNRLVCFQYQPSYSSRS